MFLNTTALYLVGDKTVAGFDFCVAIAFGPDGLYFFKLHRNSGPAPRAIRAADFNGVGATNVQDIFDFLAAWFAGC